MQNRQVGKIIGVTDNSVTVLLESGKSEQIFKSLHGSADSLVGSQS